MVKADKELKRWLAKELKLVFNDRLLSIKIKRWFWNERSLLLNHDNMGNQNVMVSCKNACVWFIV